MHSKKQVYNPVVRHIASRSLLQREQQCCPLVNETEASMLATDRQAGRRIGSRAAKL